MVSPRKSIASELESARAAVYREHLLGAAERVFARCGYEKATIREIAKEAEISVGSVYGVFQGKAVLYSAVHARHYNALASLSVAATKGGRTVMDILITGAAVTAQYFCSHPDFLRIQIQSGHAWSVESNSNDQEQAAWTAGLALITQTIAEGIRKGSVRAGNAERHARIIMAGYQAILVDWLKSGAQESTEQIVAELQELCRRVLAP